MNEMQQHGGRADLSHEGEGSVGAAVHDLTNAIAVLKIRLVLLQREPLDPAQARHVTALQSAMERACVSLERLRALHTGQNARGDSGHA